MEEKEENITLQTTGSSGRAEYNCQLYRFIISVGITGTLCIFGIVGNVLTLIVFRKMNKTSGDKKGRSSAHLLLSALAISDLLLLFTLYIVKVIPSFISFTKSNPNFFVSYIFSFLMIYGWNSVDVAQCINTWITVTVTAHRFIAIVSPHRAAIYCTYRKASLHLVVICMLVVIYEIPIFFDNVVKEIKTSGNKTIYVPSYTHLNLNHWYQLLYKTTIYYIIMYIVPWFALALMTFHLVKAIKKAKEFRSQMGNTPDNQDNTDDITMSLVAVVVASLVCRPWEPVRRVLVAILKDEPGCGHYYFYFEEFPSLTSAVNSSINFMLYCMFLKRFPHILKEIFRIEKRTQDVCNSVATTVSTLSKTTGF